MTGRREILERFIGREIQFLNRDIVLNKKPLKDLLSGVDVLTFTKDRDRYVFDLEAVKKAASKCCPLHRYGDVLLPVYFYVDSDVEGECYLRDELEADFLKKVAGLEGYRFHKGRMWIPKVLANKIMRDYPTLFQYFFLP